MCVSPGFGLLCFGEATSQDWVPQITSCLGKLDALNQGSANLFGKGPGSKYLDFAGRTASVTTTQFCPGSTEAARDNL